MRAFATIFLLWLAVRPAPAQVLFVDDSAAPGGNGSSWSTAYDDLALAVAAGGGAEIWVAEGVYRPGSQRTDSFFLARPIALYGGFAGTETARDDRDPVLHPTVLSGDLASDDTPYFQHRSDNSFHVVTVQHSGPVVVDGFVIEGGSAADANSTLGFVGGGILVLSGAPTIERCLLRDNQAGLVATFSGAGGAIGVPYPFAGASLRVVDCCFEGNDAAFGGGIYSEASIDVLGCTFQSQHATDGGGILGFGFLVRVENCDFEANLATAGGAIAVFDHALEVTNSRFHQNRATDGGAIYVSSRRGPATGRVTDSVLERNFSNVGAAISAVPSIAPVVLDVERCRLQDNVGAFPAHSGAIATSTAGGIATVTIRNTLMIDNIGAHILLATTAPGGSQLELESCTLVQTAGLEPAINNPLGTAVVHHSIVWGAGDPQLLGGAQVVNSCVSGTIGGMGSQCNDPGFVSNLPGGAGDFHLAPGSTLIDAGDPAFLPPGRDLDGFPRLLDGLLDGVLRVDLGAFEFHHLDLSVAGLPQMGQSLQIDVMGPTGVPAFLLLGTAPAEALLPRWGTLFVDFRSPWFLLPWGALPSSRSVPVLVPVPPGTSFVLQAGAAPGGGVTLSNPVFLLAP